MTKPYVMLDKRHAGQTEATFTPHFTIMKAWFEGLGDGRVWLLYGHIRMAGWRILGRYETQQEAMSATDLEWSI